MMFSGMLRSVALAAGLLVLLAAPGLAREPIKFDGTVLDHRVLTRPGAMLVSSPDGGDTVARPAVFSAFYVFAKEDRGGVSWLEVGANRTTGSTAWIKADETVDWRQTIVVGFTNPVNRLPALFFNSCEEVEAFLRDEAMSTRAELLAMAIRQGDGTGESGVIAVEPEEHIDLSEQFYVLPILDHKLVRVNRRPRRILEVASFNQADAQGNTAGPAEPLSVGIVFVIDTSTSMQDYIDVTKDMVERVILDLLDAQAADQETARFSFGMVGFRSSTEIVPGLGYTSKIYHPLQPDFDHDAFLDAIEGLNATTVSSHDFDEDGLAGMVAAAEMDGWEAFAGRYIIYISDAGMLVGTENGAASDMTPQQLATRLQDTHGILTLAMPLQTPAGRAYHDDTAAQLRALTYREDQRSSYVFPIEDGDIGIFSQKVQEMTEAVLDNVRKRAAEEQGGSQDDPCEADPTSIACAISGPQRAMELAWLGSANQTQAPSFYRACVPDFALDDPRRRALSPRVLLTRAQLNDMYVTLQSIVEAYTQAGEQTSPEEFFQVLRTVLARMLRDPSTLQSLNSATQASVPRVEDFDDLGDLLGPYLQGLPYESDLGNVTLESWEARGGPGRYEFIEGLKGKLSMYELYYADADSWIALTADADPSEEVYPLPLELLP